ncbi:hypothetical protein [Kribbella sp. NPDC051620]|uniref:hypothetical protein n=1 Tax=Kribbella sp. NPDC051620 TaxID=3364120 RepID=UPI0037AD2008
MAEQPRRRTDSEVPDIGDGLWERIQAAVLAESGADKSLWSGQLGYTDPAKRVRGEAYGDGRLNLSEESVVRPLREMYEQRGEPATREQLVARRSAIQVAAHEFGHLVVPEEYQLADRSADMKVGELKPIEEGVNEAWSQAKTDAVIDRALPPDLARQLKSAQTLRTYPGWDSAARAFADDLGAEIDVDGDDVLSVMNREARSGKGRAAADLLYEHSELPRLVPSDQQAAVRAELQGRIDKGFAALKPLDTDKTVNRRATGRQRGQELAESVVGAVRAAEKQYGPPAAEAKLSYEQQMAYDDARIAAAMLGGQAPAAGAVRSAATAEGIPRSGRPTGRSTETRER